MRNLRARRRNGLHYVRVTLHVTEIDKLVRMGLLKEEERRDPKVIQSRVQSLVSDWVLDDSKVTARIAGFLNRGG